MNKSLPSAKPKKKKERPQVPQVPRDASGREADTTAANPFDFGGLPQRDLKKNLGCG